MSRWNDRVQAALFSPNRWRPTYPESAITTPVSVQRLLRRVRGAPTVDAAPGGSSVAASSPTSARGRSMNFARCRRQSQITRHVCVEGWSAIGQWRGVPFAHLPGARRCGHAAPLCRFQVLRRLLRPASTWPTALHPQTILALDYGDAAAAAEIRLALKLRVPTKLGFKNPKHIAAIYVTNDYPGGYWEDQGYNWFSGS